MDLSGFLRSEDVKCASRNNCPKGILCGRRLKSDVCSPSADGDGFSAVLPLCSSACDTLFGWHSQGIRDQLKSLDRSVLQKHTDVAHQETCQKHTFKIKSPRVVNGRPVEIDDFWIHSVGTFSLFCQLFQASFTQNDLRATLALRV